MGSSPVNELSTSGQMNESDNEGEIGLEQFLGFPGQLISYPPGSDAFRKFCKAKAVVEGKWGNCVEFPVDSKKVVITGVKSTVERKESLLYEVTEEETVELVLEGLGLSRKKRADSRSNKALPASSTTGSGEVAKDKRRRVEPPEESGEKVVEGRSASVDDLKEVEERERLAILQGEEDTSKMVACLVKGIWLYIKEEKSELKKVETKANLDEMVEERDRLGPYLMRKGYSEEEVDAIKVDTYVEEEDEEEVEAVGIVDGLDGISCQTVFDNQGDDVELPEGGSEKAG
ncbi:hypothetical protein GIB67_029135 [Kingdonia uniflora]|uniref:Uncharacterized protein n=1 Tax=Kingdonia uniflora TaxID=39325 RepID=A0A7J7N3A3_9MAGN|nr:hypothetical protein GIB67_029135 [Kingdonia uniflora]